MNWSPWQLKFGSHICTDLVQNPSSMAAKRLEDSFAVQVPANNEDLAENQRRRRGDILVLCPLFMLRII